ncbi:MAG: P-type conjugative transfer protein TrbL [Hirschia sp.]|nr:P-type conjugative transfer protein TrbL [Hirschia sp.]MBF16906.1 P-type conjugative transfer protein TrbL [Hirschia sp.]
MDQISVIDTFLATFIAYIDSGFGLLSGDVAYLSSILIGIDITLAGLFWAMSQNTDVIAGLIKKVLYVGFFAWIIGNFAFLSGIVFDSFADLGLRAGGSTLTAADLMSPGFVAQAGYDAAHPLLAEAGDLLGPVSFFANFVTIAVLMLSWAIILAAFFILAVQLFITILEFKLTTLAGFVLVPFALWNKTTFLAERVLGNVISSGVKLMVLAVIVGIGSTLFGGMTTAFDAGDVTLEQALSAVLASVCLFGLGIFGPGIAAGLISGAPQLGAGAAVGTLIGVGAGGYLAGAGARSAAGGAISAVRAGAALSGGASTAYSLSKAASGQTGAAGVAAGLSGVAHAAGGGVARAARNPIDNLKPSTQAGANAAFTATGGQHVARRAADDADPSPAAGSDIASSIQRSQRLQHAGSMAAHSIRDGDRGGHGASPSLSNKDDQ